MIIGLPTLRLRGDYIAIVTLAFGQIIGVIAVNGTDIHIGGGMTLTAGNQGISPTDPIYIPGLAPSTSCTCEPGTGCVRDRADRPVRQPAAA